MVRRMYGSNLERGVDAKQNLVFFCLAGVQ
jgi:hypothetical protein